MWGECRVRPYTRVPGQIRRHPKIPPAKLHRRPKTPPVGRFPMADPRGNIFPREHPAYVLIVHVAMRIHLARVAAIGHHLIRLMIIDSIETNALFKQPVHHLRLLAPFAACPDNDVVPFGAQSVDRLTRPRHRLADPRPLAVVDRSVKVYCDDHTSVMLNGTATQAPDLSRTAARM